MAKVWISPKDPQEVRDYGIDWSADIGTATITSSTWTTSDVALVMVSDTHDTTTTTVRLSGGVSGQSYTVTNHVVLSDGEEGELSASLKVKDL